MVDCCIIICGLTTRRKIVNEPSPEIQQILNRCSVYYCQQCATFQPIRVYRYNKWFHLYCIPICRVKKGDEFVGCVQCQYPVQAGTAANVCSGCGGFVQQSQRFCATCGTPN